MYVFSELPYVWNLKQLSKAVDIKLNMIPILNQIKQVNYQIMVFRLCKVRMSLITEIPTNTSQDKHFEGTKEYVYVKSNNTNQCNKHTYFHQIIQASTSLP